MAILNAGVGLLQRRLAEMGIETMSGMKVRRMLRPAIVGALLISGVAAGAAPAQAPSLRALAQVEPGQWQLRETGGGVSRSVCVSDPRVLLQLRHGGGAQCSLFVIDNQPSRGTVHYTCAGAGHGRTTIQIETPRLMNIKTQGVIDGLPFDAAIEARRLGECS
ncbi:DUF3617 domain-containing protein [Sphingomonas qomolangmaensis]|uniref:DUF3617 family protein n=1 Tax=Sphingomonas qomolangmaensis TaxID=2918765 RepID=A0ABY5L959_9SPHN|nr:hypothetical protein [Sphingomonas qomolangmaensis]UUL82701.1 hypothetical protein NMP03_00150 [Sphingomonas qomolangmaensis]